VTERAGEEVQTVGRLWEDIVCSQNLSQGAVPLPHARFGAGVPKPNCCVTYTQRLRILQCVKLSMQF
jgi:hypothetical protein